MIALLTYGFRRCFSPIPSTTYFYHTGIDRGHVHLLVWSISLCCPAFLLGEQKLNDHFLFYGHSELLFDVCLGLRWDIFQHAAFYHLYCDCNILIIRSYGLFAISNPSSAGPRFNIKMLSYQYRKSHCGDKTVVRSSYLHNGISFTGKMSSLYWIRAQVLDRVWHITVSVNVQAFDSTLRTT